MNRSAPFASCLKRFTFAAMLITALAQSTAAQSNCPVPPPTLLIPSTVTGEITIGSCKQGSEYHDIYFLQNLTAGRQLRFVVTRTTLPDIKFEMTRVTSNLQIVDVVLRYEFSKTTMTVDVEIPITQSTYSVFISGETSYATGGYTLTVSDLSSASSGAQIVPIVGHLAGSGGSQFRSDLKLYNPSNSLSTGRLVFTPRGQSADASDVSITYNIPPLGVRFFQDVYVAAFPGGSGAARLVIVPDASSSKPIVDSSTYTALSDGGELAQSPTVLTPTMFMSGKLVAALGKFGERSNILVMTGTQDATIYWTYRDANGVTVKITAVKYSHDGTFQIGASDLLGVAPAANGSIEANVVIGNARVALSPVNNVSNQGRWLDFQSTP